MNKNIYQKINAMSKKFKNKYRIESARAWWWDYGNNAAYFVTVCTQNKQHFFGNIEGDSMIYSECGGIVYECWQQIPTHFPYVILNEFVIMPNHLHGIIIINKTDENGYANSPHVETRLIASLPQQPGGVTGNHNPMLHQNLSRILRWYKGRCTFEIRKIVPEFQWQSRFHDHIIRDEASYQKIKNYIKNNPANWNVDCFYDSPT